MSELTHQLRQFTFDASFQYKLFCLLVRDTTIVPFWRSLLRPQYFTDPIAQELTRLVYDYYDSYRTLPSWESLRQLASTAFKNPDAAASAASWVDYAFQTPVTDRDFLVDQVENFVRTQEMTLAVLEAADHINKGRDVDQVPGIINAAKERLANTQGDLGLFLIGMNEQQRWDSLFARPPRDTFNTFWPTANELGAVPARKELFVVAAPPNVGKTWALGNIGAAAVAQGKFVAFYTLEMSQVLSAFRVYSIISGQNDKELSHNPALLNSIVPYYQNLGGEIVIKEYETSGASTEHLQDHMMRLQIQYGRLPDMIVVDYADLLAPVSGGSGGRSEDKNVVRHILSQIYRDLRRIAIHYNIAVVTASQTNRASLSKAKITLADLAEAFDKASIADVIWALCQTEDEETSHRARLFLAKNRNETKYRTIDLSLDFGRGRMEETATGYNPASTEYSSIAPGGASTFTPPTQSGQQWTHEQS